MTQKEKLLSELAEIQESERKLRELRPHDFFKPLPGGQKRFWNSPLKEKHIFGGNQVGKTINVVNYVIHKCSTIPNQRWYMGSTSMDRSKKVTQSKFWEWVNKDDLKDGVRYRGDLGFGNECCQFKNGSIVFFLSYEMDQDKWAGDTIDGVAFDEEPPWHIFTESQKRVTIKHGEIISAMTALKSFTRFVNRVYMMDDPNIGVYSVPLHENCEKNGGVFSDKRIREIIAETPESERPSRIYGIPTYQTGLVYCDWKDEFPWVIPQEKEFAIPNDWTRYIGIDPHAALPQAAVCIAVAPNGHMYQYQEFWIKETIPMFAQRLKVAGSPVPFEACLIDNHYSTQPNAESGKTIKQLLIEHGDIFTIGGCDDVIARIDMVKIWDRINPATGRPMLQTFHSCTQTRWERKRYEWQAPISEKVAERRDAKQRPKEKNGHLMNCTEYLAAYGGKDGLEYIAPPLTPEMAKKQAYYEEKQRQIEIEEAGETEEENYMETCSAMYM